MNLTKEIRKIIAISAFSLKLLTACSTTDNYQEEYYPPIEGPARIEIEKEVEEYKNLDIFFCTRNTSAFIWNYNLPGAVNGYYEKERLPEKPSEPRLRLELIRIREDKKRNGLDDDKWVSENKRYHEFKWQIDTTSSPPYYIMIRDDDGDGYDDKEYYYTLLRAGMIRATFDLEEIRWDRNKDRIFSKSERVWRKN